jgi:hypothetical protein
MAESLSAIKEIWAVLVARNKVDLEVTAEKTKNMFMSHNTQPRKCTMFFRICLYYITLYCIILYYITL